VAIPSLVLIVFIAAATTPQAPKQICAIDMGSNTFRRIVGSFENGRYEQRSIERKTLGVGDDVARHGGISDAKLAEIQETPIGFARSCQTEGVTRVVAIGTAAFREAPNGATVIALAAKHRISMEIATERRESELAVAKRLHSSVRILSRCEERLVRGPAAEAENDVARRAPLGGNELDTPAAIIDDGVSVATERPRPPSCTERRC
jgi:Ppx/GppA phosphatase family